MSKKSWVSGSDTMLTTELPIKPAKVKPLPCYNFKVLSQSVEVQSFIWSPCPGGKKDMVPENWNQERKTSGLTLAKNKTRFRSWGSHMSGPHPGPHGKLLGCQSQNTCLK